MCGEILMVFYLPTNKENYNSSLMMEAVYTSETSVDNYFTRKYIPEDNSEKENYKFELYTHILCNSKKVCGGREDFRKYFSLKRGSEGEKFEKQFSNTNNLLINI
jgi:hypothetical protein